MNGLRIDEAVKKLKAADLKITDIAYSVGFDSLVTFNRVFKKAKEKPRLNTGMRCNKKLNIFVRSG